MSVLVSKSNKVTFAEISDLPCFIDGHCQISVLIKGESHLCFKVVFSKNGVQKHYFVKSLSEHQLTSQAEVNSHLSAAEHGFAPAVIFYSSLWLVSEFIEGYSLQQFCANHPKFSLASKVTIAMSLMTKNHQLKASKEHLVINVAELLTSLVNLNIYTQRQKVVLTQIIKKTTSFPSSNNNLVLCHGDVNDENIRLSTEFKTNQLNENTWLVDFECSSLAEAEYDIAMYLAINQLSVSNIDEVVYSYQQYSTSLINSEKVRGYLACCYLINGLWYLEAGSESEQAKAFAAKACQQFVLFDQLALAEDKVVPLLNALLAN
ncbi:MAG: phosphotransferase [Colwellia sp.]|nr:phosphotransferase [Colwellia sp.]